MNASMAVGRRAMMMAVQRPFASSYLHTLKGSHCFTHLAAPTRGGYTAQFLLQTMSTSSSSSSPAASPTSQLLKELRTRTGAPMVECKKALSAEGVQGDLDKATDWLRKYGSAKAASKLVGRETKEGLIGMAISNDYTRATIVQVACETDFSARSHSFIHLVDTVVLSALLSSSSSSSSSSSFINTDTLMSTSLYNSHPQDTSMTIPPSTATRSVKDLLDETVLAIRENLHIVKALSLQAPPRAPQAVVAGYIHGKLSNHSGTCAALVTLLPTPTCTLTTREALFDVGKKLAMHIVAAKPLYLSPLDIPQSVLDKERDIILEQMNQTQSHHHQQQQQQGSTKSKDIVDKIIMGKVKKFQEQVCVMEQAHMVQEGNPKVSKYLQGLGVQLVAYEACFVH